MKIIDLIMQIVNMFTKKVPSEPTVEDEPIIEEVEIEPKLTVSDKEPTDGEDRDVWIKYVGVE